MIELKNENRGSFAVQFGDHFRSGDHFWSGIIRGAVQFFRSSFDATLLRVPKILKECVMVNPL